MPSINDYREYVETRIREAGEDPAQWDVQSMAESMRDSGIDPDTLTDDMFWDMMADHDLIGTPQENVLALDPEELDYDIDDNGSIVTRIRDDFNEPRLWRKLHYRYGEQNGYTWRQNTDMNGRAIDILTGHGHVIAITSDYDAHWRVACYRLTVDGEHHVTFTNSKTIRLIAELTE